MAGGFGVGQVRRLQVLDRDRGLGRDAREQAVDVPPSISSLTFVVPGTLDSVRTSWESRASRLSALLPPAKRSPRSTVATPSTTLTERTGVPAGT